MKQIHRKPFIDTFREAAEWGSHDELPMLPEATDPQLFASRSKTPQPFFLSCEKDSMIVLMAGHADILMKHPDLRRLRAGPGDFIYIPARTPHRVIPRGEIIQYRFKAREAGREGVTWYCDACGEVISSYFWDSAVEGSHQAYDRATRAFNENESWRTCPSCGHAHPPFDLASVRWAQIAAQAKATEEVAR